MRPKLVLSGVIPANLLPFDSSLKIDEKSEASALPGGHGRCYRRDDERPRLGGGDADR
jgi:hypothetical protein